MKTARRYVELTYTQPGNEETKWFAVVTEAGTPNQALDNAKAVLLERHPQATHAHEFMQRILEDARADQIEAAMANGSWTGWEFETHR